MLSVTGFILVAGTTFLAQRLTSKCPNHQYNTGKGSLLGLSDGMHTGRGCCDWLARFLLGGFSFSYVNDVFIFEHSGDSSLMKMFPYQPVPNPDRKPNMWKPLHTTSVSVAEALRAAGPSSSRPGFPSLINLRFLWT